MELRLDGLGFFIYLVFKVFFYLINLIKNKIKNKKIDKWEKNDLLLLYLLIVLI